MVARESGHEESFVLLDRAPDAMIAGLWVSMLEAAGIQAYTPGTFLTDEWAATQRVLGNAGFGADVFVPRTRLDEARRIIESEPIEAGFEDEAEPPDQAEEVPPEQPVGAAPEIAAASMSRGAILFEILAVCCVTVVPYYVWSISGLIARGFRPSDSGWSTADIVEILAAWIPQIVLLRWVISRTGEPPSSFGWVRIRPFQDLLLGIVILAGWLLISGIIAGILSGVIPATAFDNDVPTIEAFVLGAREPELRVHRGALEWIIYAAAALGLAFLEEFSTRGYLLVRLNTLLGSRLKAAAISSGAWAGAHLYQGLLPVGTHFIEGLVLAWAFLKVRRLWPFVLAHAGFNVFLDLAG